MPAAPNRSHSPIGTDADDATAGPKLDGRRTHIIDRALEYALLAEQGMSAARIARKRRRSEGYVSIALRLGRAIRGMEPAEIAALRSPRITWKLAQRIVREDADALAIRHQLRSALGGFSTHNVDGRARRGRGRTAAERPVGAAWGWDAAWFTRDPLGYVDAHLRYLAGLQRVVQERATRAVGTRAADRMSVGQGIRSLQRSVARAAGEAAESSAHSPERRALGALELIARKLAEARDDAAAVLAARPGEPASERASDGRAAGFAARRAVPLPARTPLARPLTLTPDDEFESLDD